MTVLKLKNNASSYLTVSLASAGLSATVADGSALPVLAAGDYFYATIQDVDNPAIREIVMVTALAGNVATIVRAQEGTIALDFGLNSFFEQRITAQTIEDFIKQNSDLARAISSSVTSESTTTSADSKSVKTAFDKGAEGLARAEEVRLEILGGTPAAALDTLKELADALQDNDSEIASMITAISSKLDKTGKAADTFLFDGQSPDYYPAKDVTLAVGAELGTVDLNDYVTTGIFGQTNNIRAADGVNYPADVAGKLTVEVTGVFVYQSYSTYNGTGKFRRLSRNGGTSWDGWDKIYDSGNKPSAADISAISATTETNVKTHTTWDDGYHIRLGTGNDLQFHHDGIHSYMRSYTGNLHIRSYSNGGDIHLQAESTAGQVYTAISILAGADVEVSLKHNVDEKLKTQADGVNITGHVKENGVNLEDKYAPQSSKIFAFAGMVM